MKWEGCRVFVHDAAGELVCEDDEVDLTIVLPGESDGSEDAPPTGSIFLLYWDEEGAVAFSGARKPDGSFQLSCRSRPRTATLAWSEDQRRLEGDWAQGEEHGSLCVERGEAAPEPAVWPA